MAGSITVTRTREAGCVVHDIAWTSDAAGDVSANSFSIRGGILEQVIFIPDTGGSQPTDLYDVTMTGPDDVGTVDLLQGVGANLANAAISHHVPMVGDGTTTDKPVFLRAGAYTPVVANAGNAKGGRVILAVR